MCVVKTLRFDKGTKKGTQTIGTPKSVGASIDCVPRFFGLTVAFMSRWGIDSLNLACASFAEIPIKKEHSLTRVDNDREKMFF